MRKATAILVIGAVLITIVALFTLVDVTSLTMQLTKYMQSVDPISGAMIVVFLCTVLTLLVLPSTVLNLIAGYLFGTILGTVSITIGCMVPALIAFFLGKTLLRTRVDEYTRSNPSIRALCVIFHHRKNKLTIQFNATKLTLTQLNATQLIVTQNNKTYCKTKRTTQLIV